VRRRSDRRARGLGAVAAQPRRLHPASSARRGTDSARRRRDADGRGSGRVVLAARDRPAGRDRLCCRGGRNRGDRLLAERQVRRGQGGGCAGGREELRRRLRYLHVVLPPTGLTVGRPSAREQPLSVPRCSRGRRDALFGQRCCDDRLSSDGRCRPASAVCAGMVFQSGDRIASEVLDRFGGRFVKSTGDGLLACLRRRSQGSTVRAR
jgi:hypothetical protein